MAVVVYVVGAVVPPHGIQSPAHRVEHQGDNTFFWDSSGMEIVKCLGSTPAENMIVFLQGGRGGGEEFGAMRTACRCEHVSSGQYHLRTVLMKTRYQLHVW
ncbi:uncharacterized protein [Lolium perenne]|uniref:uncharacterized protein n=1 Tax=Lolium perenne TaxID=4522 RepID=UPI003A99192A